MFDLEKSIADWRQQMIDAGISVSALDELENHLRETVERQIRSGAHDQEAFQQAILEIGHPKELKKEFAKDRGALSLLGKNKFQAIDRIVGVLWLVLCSLGFVMTSHSVIRNLTSRHPWLNVGFLIGVLLWASYGTGIVGSVLVVRGSKPGRSTLGIIAALFALIGLLMLFRLVPTAQPLHVVKCGVFTAFYAVTALLMFLPSYSNVRPARK